MDYIMESWRYLPAASRIGQGRGGRREAVLRGGRIRENGVENREEGVERRGGERMERARWL